jgi:hypothetical protein
VNGAKVYNKKVVEISVDWRVVAESSSDSICDAETFPNNCVKWSCHLSERVMEEWLRKTHNCVEVEFFQRDAPLEALYAPRDLPRLVCNLSLKNITNHDCVEYVKSLNKEIQDFDCSKNNVENEGCLLFCDAFVQLTNLEFVNFSWNNIGDEGCRALVEVLKVKTRMKTLDLSWNNIGSKGLKSVLQLLQTLNGLTVILEGNPKTLHFYDYPMLSRIQEYIKCGRLKVDFEFMIEFLLSLQLFHFSEFKSLELVGKGSYSNVCRVSNDFALKRICAYTPEAVRRTIEEGKIWSKLGDHENIVRFVGVALPNDIDEQNPSFGFVMERFDNNLKEHLASNVCPLQKRIEILRKVAKGLEFLHSKGIVHRDLHSKNILVNQDRVAIGDFGMAILLSDEVGKIEDECNGFLWQSFDEKIGPASDVFSFGILMWQVLTLGDLIEDWKLACKERKSLSEWILFQISMKGVDVSTDLAKLIENCLEVNPENRPTAKSISEKLEQHISTQ